MIRENDDDAMKSMYIKYSPIVKSFAKKYFYQAQQVGLEIEDLIQEGMIGLCNATYSFNQERDNLFYTYALVSIKRTMIKAINYNNTKKKQILNKAISYEETVCQNLTIMEMIADSKLVDPLQVVNINDFCTQLIIFMNKLSFIQSQIFELKLNGFKHREISKLLELKEKTIDNACVAIRKKLRLQNFVYLSQ
jgi:RNA polymerase sporulation-specific sigma factor